LTRNVWVWAALCAVVLTTGGAFSILFTGQAYGEFSGSSVLAARGAFLTMLGAAAVAALVGSAGRLRFVLIVPAAALYTLLAVYGWPPLFSLSGWRNLFLNIAFDVYQATGIMYARPVPYDLEPGIFVILIPVVMIVAAFATSATLYEESPIFSVGVLGLTIGVLSTISFESGAGPFFAFFLFSAVALLLASGAGEDAGRFVRPGIIAGAVVVLAVLILPKAPLAEHTISSGTVDWTRLGSGGTSRLNVQADVGEYLTAGRDAELLRVRSPEPVLWRGGTLDHFDGVRWSDTTRPDESYGKEIAEGVKTRTLRQDVQVLDAQTSIIFGAYRITDVSIFEARHRADSSWSVSRPLAEGSYYSVESKIPQPTIPQLRSTGTDYPEEVREKFLQMPNDRPQVIAETKREIRELYKGNLNTPYDKARAIERYLLYDGNFTYNLDVEYQRADRAIEEFLSKDGAREGFCTQFATSMALLAREMGLPSRVVYGSTSGQEIEPNEYIITGRNMHTWVEIYFPGVGWYPFDPTPGFSLPSVMEENAPRPTPPAASISAEERLRQSGQAVAVGQSQLDEQGQQISEDQDEAPPEDEKSGDKTGKRDGSIPWPLYALIPVLLIAAVPLTKRALLSRGRPEDLYRDLAGRLRDSLPPGRAAVADPASLTPTERMVLLAGAAGVAEEPCRQLARVYSEHLYAAEGAGGRSARSAYRRAVEAYEQLPRWRRLLAAVNPSSLFFRTGRAVAALRKRTSKSVRHRLSRKGR
jgi:transglutaminase-like putative cysteine protease